MNREVLPKYLFLLSTAMLIIWALSCSGKPGNRVSAPGDNDGAGMASSPPARIIKLVQPAENEEQRLNSSFRIVIVPDNQSDPPDSVLIWYDNRPLGSLKSQPWEMTVPPAMLAKTGRKPLKVVAYGKNNRSQTITRFMIVYSDIVPSRKGYRVVNTYPHDRNAYTQGLVFEDGILYEGTGQESKSSLRRVNLTTGEVLSQVSLEPQLFGEGIAIYGDRIFQLTWRSKVGFVYDKKSFKQLNRFYYQSEGWGLTTVGDRLLMSDGTNTLYFIDPESFTVVSTLEVYDNKSKVGDLNELEYINGEIWANIYTTDLIARIDPASGRVNSIVDLKGLLTNAGQEVDVLNGIAWDSATDRLFVTGKYWPSLFEIRITD